MCLLIQLVLGMGIALLIDSDDPGFGIIRSILTLTLVIPPAIAGMIFLIMEDANYGLIPWLLKSIGLIGPEDTILSDPTLALWGVMIVDIWQWTPFMVLILVAGLRSLPSEPFESAVIDGARPFQVFRRLTLPTQTQS
jgi:multiple sugar transport system permease protein